MAEGRCHSVILLCRLSARPWRLPVAYFTRGTPPRLSHTPCPLRGRRKTPGTPLCAKRGVRAGRERGPRVKLITRGSYGNDPASDAVLEFESAIVSSGRVEPVVVRQTLLGRLLWKAVRSVPARYGAAGKGGSECFAVLLTMGDITKCLPAFLRASRRHLYCFDAFPVWHELIELAARRLRLDTVFLSSQQAAEQFAGRCPPCAVHWVPEGIDAAQYCSRPYDRKDIDVVHIGRRFDWYHEQIRGPLAAAGRRYVYANAPGDLVFPTRQEFLDGLARSKVSICVPSSVSHPDRAGGISTMTVRYLQSMASRCLIVGLMPDDMRALFHYMPLVEMDTTHPGRQLLDILDRYSEYLPLIERNYQTVRVHHTWLNRWEQITQILASESRDVETRGS